MKKISFICAIILLFTCCTHQEVDYRDKWIGQYEYTSNRNGSGTLNVTKIGDNKIQISVFSPYVSHDPYITIEHDGTFRGSANSALTSYGTLEGSFFDTDSLAFSYYTGMGHNAPFYHVTYKAKKISSSL